MFTTNWHEKSNAPLPTFYGEEGARLPNRRLLASKEYNAQFAPYRPVSLKGIQRTLISP
jgi:hypothetical protein